MYCPKCKKEFTEESEYCPFCGYKLSDYKKDIIKKFSDKNKRNYILVLSLSLLIAIASIVLVFVFPKYFYIFLIFPCISFFIDQYLSRTIGKIDIENTPKEIMDYLRKTSLIVLVTNLLNIITIIYGIVKIIMALI